MSHYVEM